MLEKLNKWVDLYQDAVTKKQTIDARYTRQNQLYKGSNDVIRRDTGTTLSEKKAYTYRNIIFEMIETQIDNRTPLPKITPRDPLDMPLALQLENYLKNEMDRLNSEEINDMAERGTYKHGTAVYFVGWDETDSTPTTRGEVYIKYYPLNRVFPQPGVTRTEDLEYIFTKDLVSTKKIKELYGKEVTDSTEYRGMAELITAWYYNEDGNVSRLGWVDDTIIFDDEDYEIRQVLTCKDCGEVIKEHTVCPVCGGTKFKWSTLEEEIITEDIVTGDVETGEMRVIAKAGSTIPYYKIKQLPFVIRRNISDEESLYGVSDIDMIEQNQESMNKIITKLEENILKAGSIFTVPKGVKIPMTDETLKVVTLSDPNQVKAFSVQSIQANMQQDIILQEQLYQFARAGLGITDSYQGKRDPTAESGKAKEIAAAQASGRLESKRKMKEAAYADLYKLLFKFLLAYCDEPRAYSRTLPNGTHVEGTFNRYNFLDEKDGIIFYNDRFLFSVDSASILSTNREAMWQENTRNFQLGTFGNPADPNTLLMYWTTMQGLGYPLAKEVLSNLQERAQQLPPEIEQAILQNPEILDRIRQEVAGNNAENSKQQN